jgi:methyl-accepting chemotaxis protein
MKNSIKFKLGGILATIVILLFMIVAGTFWTTGIQKTGSQLVNLSGRQRMLIQRFTKEFCFVEMSYVMDNIGSKVQGRGDGAASYQKTQKIFETTLAGFMTGGKVPLDLGMTKFMRVDAIKDATIASKLKEVKALWEELISQTKSIKNGEVGESSYRAATEKLQKLSGTTTKQMNAAVGMIAAASNAAAKRIVNIQLFVMFFTVALCAIGWLIISRTIVNPILSVTRMARKIADGDLSSEELTVKSRDEVGQLSTALNRMNANLNKVIEKVQITSDRVGTATVQLSATATEIVSGTEVQSSQAAQVATAMEEMSATVTEVAKNSQSASDSAGNAQDVAVKGGDVVKSAVEGMLAVADTVKESAATVEALGKSSEEIGTIISVINDIADQTNLLALNAAIEAARAGEQGRGFAVVADEVRKLAEKTTKATKEIADMIKTIQGDTKGAMESMERGTVQVEEGVNLTTEAGVALTEIVSSIEETSTMVRQIAVAAEQQSATTEEISSNINSIADVSNKTSEGVGDISSASTDLNHVAEELKAIVNSFVIKKSSKAAVKAKANGNANGVAKVQPVEDEKQLKVV